MALRLDVDGLEAQVHETVAALEKMIELGAPWSEISDLGLREAYLAAGEELPRTPQGKGRYVDDMVNPTFSLGTYSFANLRAFLENRPTSFIGLTPEAEFDRLTAETQEMSARAGRIEALAGLENVPSDGDRTARTLEPTSRQQEILIGMAAGLQTKEIAARCNLAMSRTSELIAEVLHLTKTRNWAAAILAAVEEGWIDNGVASMTVEAYLGSLKQSGIDTLILGCTHYPLLKKAIRNYMGSAVQLVDSAEEIAREVGTALEKQSLARREGIGNHSFFVTDAPDRFIKVGGRFLGEKVESAVRIER